jgi:hypothetical protein
MIASLFLPVSLAVTFSAADARSQVMSLTLNVNSQIRVIAGAGPEMTEYYAWPFITASDDMGEPLTQQVQASSPGGQFEGYINHPSGWTASSTVYHDAAAFEDELFNNGDWELRDFTSIEGFAEDEAVYTFSVSGSETFLDGLGGTLITDNAHLLDLGAPTFEWANPGGLYDAMNVYLYDLTDTSLGTSALLDGDAASWSPAYTLLPGHEYQLSVNQRRDTSGLVTISEPAGDDPFPYQWFTSADVNANGVYEFTAVPEPHEHALAAGAALLGMALWRRARRPAVASAPLRRS